jgi:hypothetical protein
MGTTSGSRASRILWQRWGLIFHASPASGTWPPEEASWRGIRRPQSNLKYRCSKYHDVSRVVQHIVYDTKPFRSNIVCYIGKRGPETSHGFSRIIKMFKFQCLDQMSWKGSHAVFIFIHINREFGPTWSGHRDSRLSRFQVPTLEAL